MLVFVRCPSSAMGSQLFSRRALLATYAAFASLAIPLSGSAEEQLVVSDTEEGETLVPEITVTSATRTERALATTPAPVQLVSREEIEAMGATTLRDILELTPSVYVSPTGGNLQVRGLGHSDTVYLIDGRRIKGEFSNTYELERIAASMVERIEILRGPASVLYGADALGGVINIITRRPHAGVEAGLDVQYGANTDGNGGRRMASFDVHGGEGPVRYGLYASTMRRSPYSEEETAMVTVPQSGNQVPPSSHPNSKINSNLQDSYLTDVDYRDKAEVETLGGYLKVTPAEAWAFTFELNYMQETREGSYISSRYPTAFTANDKTIQAVNIPARQFDDNARLDLAATVDWAASKDLDVRYRIYRSRYTKDRVVYALPYGDLGYDSAEASQSSVNVSVLAHLVHELTSVWRPRAGHRVMAGLEHRDNDVDTSSMEAEGRTFRSAFLQHEWTLSPRFNAVYGARYDHVSVGESQVSLQAGAVWSPSPLARLRVNYAQGFKAPDDRVLYVNQVNPQGVPMLGAEVIEPDKGKSTAHSLKPEISETIELGLAGGGKGWHYGVSVFQTTIDDRIETVQETVDGATYNTFRNITEARIRGVEAEGGVRLATNLRTRFAVTGLEAENRSTGEDLQETPNLLATLYLDYHPTPAWIMQAIVRHTGEQDYLATNGTATADAYTKVHVKASYFPPSFPEFEVYGGINNLFDAKVETALGSDPGPYAYLGVRYRYSHHP